MDAAAIDRAPRVIGPGHFSWRSPTGHDRCAASWSGREIFLGRYSRCGGSEWGAPQLAEGRPQGCAPERSESGPETRLYAERCPGGTRRDWRSRTYLSRRRLRADLPPAFDATVDRAAPCTSRSCRRSRSTCKPNSRRCSSLRPACSRIRGSARARGPTARRSCPDISRSLGLRAGFPGVLASARTRLVSPSQEVHRRRPDWPCASSSSLRSPGASALRPSPKRCSDRRQRRPRTQAKRRGVSARLRRDALPERRLRLVLARRQSNADDHEQGDDAPACRKHHAPLADLERERSSGCCHDEHGGDHDEPREVRLRRSSAHRRAGDSDRTVAPRLRSGTNLPTRVEHRFPSRSARSALSPTESMPTSTRRSREYARLSTYRLMVLAGGSAETTCRGIRHGRRPTSSTRGSAHRTTASGCGHDAGSAR